MNKNLITRTLSGAVILVLSFGANFFGGIVLLLGLTLCSQIALFEFYRAVGILKDKKIFTPITVMGYGLSLIYYIFSYFLRESVWQLFFIVALIVLTMAVYVFTFPKYDAGQIAYCIFGFIYVPVMLSFIYYVRMHEFGLYTVWLIYIASWVCDTCAYFTGVAFGKHKLAPILSPKKSIEGAIGGILGAMLGGYLYARFYLIKFMPESIWGVVLICAIGAIVSQIGDLAASAIKRNHDIKDYSHLIPGHGGILDRFDSVIFTAPMIYFLLIFVVHVH